MKVEGSAFTDNCIKTWSLCPHLGAYRAKICQTLKASLILLGVCYSMFTLCVSVLPLRRPSGDVLSRCAFFSHPNTGMIHLNKVDVIETGPLMVVVGVLLCFAEFVLRSVCAVSPTGRLHSIPAD